MARELHDFYFKEAKREGYRSRAAYKLLEINERRRVLSKGDIVLDCGCAPGSWVQVIAKIVGPRGFVVGIDLKEVDPLPEPNIAMLVGDLREADAATLLGPAGSEIDAFDVVLSDMAPDTSGDRSLDHHGSVNLCHAVLDRCATVLRPGGNLAMKVFEGEAYRDLLDRTKTCFDEVKGFSPKASRKVSTEIYICAKGYTPVEQAPSIMPAKKKPSGWS